MIASIQILRGLAALMVVLHHATWKCEQYSINPIRWYTFGAAGVDLFFLISGYIMCQVSYGKSEAFWSFLLARFKRIIPIYWLLSVVALGVYLVAPRLVNSGGGNTDIISSFLLLPTQDKYLIQNGWTLSYEFLFYFIFAFGLNFFQKDCHLVVTVALLSILALIGAVVVDKSYIGNFFFSDLLCEFALGMLAYKISSRISSIDFCFSIPMVVVGFALLIMLPQPGEYGLSRLFVWGGPMAVIFIAVRGMEESLQALRDRAPFRWSIAIGDSSYSLYLVHPFALAAVAIFLKKCGIAGDGLVFGVLLVIAALAFGWLFHVCLEKPILKISKSFLLK